MTQVPSADQCTTMSEIRAGVDEVDRRLVALLACRFGYMNAAARIKPDRASVHDEGRKADVLAKVEAAAVAAGIEPALVSRLYEDLIESSIAHELRRWDALHHG